LLFAGNISGDACAWGQQASTLETFFKNILSDTTHLDKFSWKIHVSLNGWITMKLVY